MAEEFETVEMEYSEDDILYYLVDENDVEVGFVIEEDGKEVECYYEEYEDELFEIVDEPADRKPSSSTAPSGTSAAEEDPGYLRKIATIAGFEADKGRQKAEVKLDAVRGKAEKSLDKAKGEATKHAAAAKAKKDEMGLEISREDIKETTSDLNALAKEGAETARELKEAYDDIMDSYGFLLPKGARRRLP